MQNSVSVGEYLLRAIRKMGVDRVFGIPGDMIIKFFKLIEKDPGVELCTFSHEPAVGFAAIASARATGNPAVACVTYGPGALSLLNSVACAYAEKVPLIVIAGGPPMSARAKNFLMHHTVKGFDFQLKIYSEVTQEAVILDSSKTAAARIAQALGASREYSLPVYIEVPADIVDEPIQQPLDKPVYLAAFEGGALEKATNEILQRINTAKKPVFMLGVEVVRYGLTLKLLALAKKLNVPVVSTMLSRDALPVRDANFFGVYLGKAGNPTADQLVAESDLILMLGEAVSDVTIGEKLSVQKEKSIVQCVSREVKTAACTFSGVPLKELVGSLCAEKFSGKTFSLPEKSQLKAPEAPKRKQAGTSLVTDDVVDAVNLFFSEHGEMPVFSDTGDCLFATLRLKASSVFGSSYYGTMGFAVPAAIGFAVSTGKRALVLVGDGAFQMTGQEICHCPRYGVNPIFIIVNNRLWGMEQLFHPSATNVIMDWPYATMAELWGGKGYRCDSFDGLCRALEDAERQKTFTLVEVITDGRKLSTPLQNYFEDQRRSR